MVKRKRETSKALVFQLWDTEAGSAVGGYETEEAAMAIVRSAFERFGPEDVRTLALFSLDNEQHLALLADGETLLRRVKPGVTA